MYAAGHLALDLPFTGRRWQRRQLPKQASHLQRERSNAGQRSAYERARSKTFKSQMRGNRSATKKPRFLLLLVARS
ncbi:MAG TPA: hypothetical protein VH593_22615 [Ktedonobacteraceae bacterium]